MAGAEPLGWWQVFGVEWSGVGSDDDVCDTNVGEQIASNVK